MVPSGRIRGSTYSKRLFLQNAGRDNQLRSIPVRKILKRKAVERSRIAAVAQPFAEMIEAEPTVEVACRVPVKHLKIDPLPAALDSDPEAWSSTAVRLPFRAPLG